MSDLTGTDLAVSAATAVADLLPSAVPLTVGPAQVGSEHAAAAFAGAVRADLTGHTTGRVAVLVGADLVGALANSPIGGLDLAAAAQPAIDALAETLALSADAALQVDLSLAVSDLGEPFVVVPLIGAGIDAAVLVPDRLLQPRLAVVPTFTPEASDAPVQDDAVPTGGGRRAAIATAEPSYGGGEQVTSTRSRRVADGPVRGIEMLHGVDLEVTVELGRTRMTVRDLLALSPGAVLELDRAAGSPADLLVNGRLIARGEVVVVDEDFGLRITEVVDESAVG